MQHLRLHNELVSIITFVVHFISAQKSCNRKFLIIFVLNMGIVSFVMLFVLNQAPKLVSQN